MFSGSMNSVLGTSYTSEDSDLVATEQSYAAMENELQQEIDAIESTHPGYDEYRYDLDTIGHNPHELASYLTALLQSYTPQSAQAELKAAVRLTVHLDADGRNRDTHHHRRGGQRGRIRIPYLKCETDKQADCFPCGRTAEPHSSLKCSRCTYRHRATNR